MERLIAWVRCAGCGEYIEGESLVRPDGEYVHHNTDCPYNGGSHLPGSMRHGPEIYLPMEPEQL